MSATPEAIFHQAHSLVKDQGRVVAEESFQLLTGPDGEKVVLPFDKIEVSETTPVVLKTLVFPPYELKLRDVSPGGVLFYVEPEEKQSKLPALIYYLTESHVLDLSNPTEELDDTHKQFVSSAIEHISRELLWEEG